MPKPIRPIRIEGNVAYVTLTRGYEAVIDAEDVPLVSGRNWFAKADRNTVYAASNDYSGLRCRTIRLHRVLMGDPIGLEVDHIDGDGLNNCKRGERCNLRIATHQQNMYNQRISKKNSSGLKGVSRDKGKWRARIRVGQSVVYLGGFHTPELAHAAYSKASAEMHGAFGKTS